jgi:hypothetical protein
MKKLIPSLVLLLVAAPLLADEIRLVGGGTIVGQIVEKTADRVVVDTGPGRVTFPTSRVASIKTGRSALFEFRERLRAIDPQDAEGFVALGRWADAVDLDTQAGEAYQRALAADPTNASANLALGRVEQGGRWISQDDAYRAQGLVRYDGRWVSPEERAAAEQSAAQSSLAATAQREAEARAREAEARARAAEAEARQAEAQAAPAEGDGIPVWPYLYGGGTVLWPPVIPPDRPHRPRPVQPQPQPTHPPGGSLKPTPTNGNGTSPAPKPVHVKREDR